MRCLRQRDNFRLEQRRIDSNSSQKNSKNAIRGHAKSSASADFLGFWNFGGYTGPIVLPDDIAPLITAGALSWLCCEFLDDSGLANLDGLAVAAAHATHIIIVPDIDAVAGRLAAAGGRVLLIERRDGVRLPVLRGGECRSI